MVTRPVHCRVQSSAKCHYRFQKCLWEENKGETYGRCSICLVSTSAEALWVWPVVCCVFCFSQKHKFSRKSSPWRRFMVMATSRLLFRKWHLRHCRLPENLKHVKSPNLLEAPFCLLKPLRFCLLRCSWHPHAEPCIRSVSAPSCQQSTPHLFLAFCFLIIHFGFFFPLRYSRRWNIPHKTTPSPSSQRSLSFLDNIHHHPLWLNPQSGSFKPPIIRVYDPSVSEQADHPSPWRMEIQRLRFSRSGVGLTHQWCLKHPCQLILITHQSWAAFMVRPQRFSALRLLTSISHSCNSVGGTQLQPQLRTREAHRVWQSSASPPSISSSCKTHKTYAQRFPARMHQNVSVTPSPSCMKNS